MLPVSNEKLYVNNLDGKNLFHFPKNETVSGYYNWEDSEYAEEEADRQWSYTTEGSKITISDPVGDLSTSYGIDLTFNIFEILNNVDPNKTLTISVTTNDEHFNGDVSFGGHDISCEPLTFTLSTLDDGELNIVCWGWNGEICIQIEESTAATEYEDYSKTYISDSNGIINLIVDDSQLKLFANDNITVSTNYIKNINKELGIIPNDNPDSSLVVGADIKDVLRTSKQTLTKEQINQVNQNLDLVNTIKDNVPAAIIHEEKTSLEGDIWDVIIYDDGSFMLNAVFEPDQTKSYTSKRLPITVVPDDCIVHYSIIKGGLSFNMGCSVSSTRFNLTHDIGAIQKFSAQVIGKGGKN